MLGTTTDGSQDDEIAEAEEELTSARAEYRAASQDVTRRLTRLASLSIELFPELPKLHPDAGITDFQSMHGLLLKGIGSSSR